MSTNNSSYRPPARPPVNPKTGEYAYKPPANQTAHRAPQQNTSNTRPPAAQKRRSSRNQPPLWLSVITFIVLVILLGPSISDHFSDLFNTGSDVPSTPSYTLSAEDMTALQEADDVIYSIEAPFLLNGYVPDAAAPDCVAEVADYAEDLVQEGVLQTYSNDGCSVWMLHKSGLQTIYVPPKADTLAFNTNDIYSIVTMEPYAGTFEPQYDPYLSKNSQAAVLLDNISEQWDYTRAAEAQSVTPSTIQTFGENQVIIWFGHGAWTSQNGACLITGEFFDADRYRTDEDYRALFTGGYLARTAGAEPRVVVTSKYIETYAGSMENSVVFLGACYSSKGAELVSAFLQKGAQAVVANSDEIRVTYYCDMMYTFVNSLCTRDSSGQYNTFGTALEAARQQHGYDDSGYPSGIGARVEIFGPDVYNLRITEAAAPEQSAVTPEPVTATPEPVTVDAYQTLANYAAQFSYLNGSSGYTGSYTKTEYRNIYSYNVPIQRVAYTIADFDQDNTDELLIVNTNSDHTIHLEMYEAFGDSVSCTSEIDLSAPVAGSAEDSITEYFYFWRDNRLQICVSEYSLSNHVATGTILRCTGVNYDGSSFSYLGMAEIVGTAGEGDPFTDDMAALGFDINLYDMLNGYTVATDYLQSCTVFCTARSMCTFTDGDWMTYQDVWFSDDSLTYLEISNIGFKRDLLG